ncbi:MAG: glycosyltransferase family 2 protein [Candidatus Omnitrophica bacterium]|nr:glycosyltransferase family 2 protein [Candidatus Omnitrophota bacterium]
MKSIDISIALIVKDEEKSIDAVLSEILLITRQISPRSYELFMIDGFSRDNTVKFAEKFGVKIIQVRGGKGDGVSRAIELAEGRYVIFIDGDGSHNPEDIIRLIKAIDENKCDLVIASRIMGGSDELGGKNIDNFLRLLGNRLSTYIINLRWKMDLTDIQNGFRIIKRSTALELKLEEKSFAVEQEMVMKCLKRNKAIIEIPGFERKRLYGSSKICKGREFWKYAWCLLKNL